MFKFIYMILRAAIFSVTRFPKTLLFNRFVVFLVAWLFTPICGHRIDQGTLSVFLLPVDHRFVFFLLDDADRLTRRLLFISWKVEKRDLGHDTGLFGRRGYWSS